MTQPFAQPWWAGPSDVEESTLHFGAELGSGGQGRVLRIADHPNLVFKQYKVRGADLHALGLLVDIPAQLPPAERERLYQQSCWPLARVFNKGQLSGFLMRQIPDQFFAANSAGDMKLRQLQFLVYPRKSFWGDIVPVTGVNAQTRISVASQFAQLLGVLHSRALVVGDVSMNNVLWSGTDAGTASICLIDCDGIRRLGSRPVLPQADTLDWNDPLQSPSGSDLDSDRYKLALLVARVLTMSPYLRPGDSLRPVPGIPDRTTQRLDALWRQAAGAHGVRPVASQWVMALSDRDEIVLPRPPVRPVPSLKYQPLDGPGVRPAIQLPPSSGSDPVTKPPSALPASAQ